MELVDGCEGLCPSESVGVGGVCRGGEGDETPSV